jgi:hypothetical protein
MGLWGSIKSAGSSIGSGVSSVGRSAYGATSGAVSTAKRVGLGIGSTVGKAGMAAADPRKVVAAIDPRGLVKTFDPRQVYQSLSTGRLPGASMFGNFAGLMPGVGMSLKDTIQASNGNPIAIAKSLMATAAASTSSKWAPQGFAKGLGPMVANIASAARSGANVATMKAVPLRRWF